MTTSLESLVAQFDTRGKPPVERWNPDRVADIDIRIDRQGDWYYRGSKIERKRMVALFSTILWREDDCYFLKTPHEKLKIQVETAPFIAVLMTVEGEGESQSLTFTDNTGNQFKADAQHKLWLTETASGESTPFVIVRRDLPALLSRAVYYQLADLIVERDSRIGVWSEGIFFSLSV